jgi:hypothetical protein
VYKQAINIIGDVIYDLDLENEALKKHIGDRNPAYLKIEVNSINKNHTTSEKRKRTLARLQRQEAIMTK